eukprot:9472506-Pyramimonas_sp.AAC.2
MPEAIALTSQLKSAIDINLATKVGEVEVRGSKVNEFMVRARRAAARRGYSRASQRFEGGRGELSASRQRAVRFCPEVAERPEAVRGGRQGRGARRD